MPAKYVRHELRIPVGIWDDIVKIAYEEWADEDRVMAKKIAPPGISPIPPKEELINDLLREALFRRKQRL